MKKYFLVILLLQICVVIFISKIFLLSNNTLSNNDNWTSGKMSLSMGVMGAEQFFTQTQPLNRNHLNLGSWHGFQEIISKDSFNFNSLEFDVLLSNDAYLVTYLQMTTDQKIGFEIGSDQSKNNCLSINQDGQFIKKTPLENVVIQSNEWVHITADITENIINIKINNQYFSCLSTELIPSQIGFKNGYSDVLLDNIVVKKSENTVFKEKFENNHDLSVYILFSFIVISIVDVLIFKMPLIRKKSFIFFIIATTISIVFSLAIFYGYLLFVFSYNYPSIKSFISNLQTKEAQWVDNTVEVISQQIMDIYEDNSDQTILFIGSSQTWGAGASTQEKRFTQVFEKLINENTFIASDSTKVKTTPTDKENNTTSVVPDDGTEQAMLASTESAQPFIPVINTGIPGTTTNELLMEYQEKWITLKPKLVFLNLASNDFTYGIDEYTYTQNIESFIKLNNENGIKTILVAEAYSNEINTPNHFHIVLKQIAEQHHIPFIDMHSYLEEKSDTGLMWWDFIHPTDYGHELIARNLYEQFTKKNYGSTLFSVK